MLFRSITAANMHCQMENRGFPTFRLCFAVSLLNATFKNRRTASETLSTLNGSLIRQVDTDGNRTEYTYNPFGQLASLTVCAQSPTYRQVTTYTYPAPGQVNEQLRRQAIGSEEVIDVRPADLLKPEMTKLRGEIGALAKSEEDVLTYAMFPDIGRKFLEERDAGTLAPEVLLPIPEAGGVARAGGEGVPTEFVIDVHGESYRVDITGVGVKAEGKRHFYLSIDGMPEEVVFEPLNEFVGGGSSKRKQATAPGHVSTAMPGNIVDVLVKEGDVVKAGQAVLITEAMKMETEVQAAIAGKVTAVHVAKGDRVNPGEILIEIEG